MIRPLLAALLASAAALPAWGQASFTLLHTGDFHSRLEPISRFDSTCGDKDRAEGKCFGGSARLATAIAAARAASNATLLIDSGDQFQGSLFFMQHNGLAEAEMMVALGYEAMAVGNHEFDKGPEALRGLLDAVDFPVLAANLDVSAEPLLAGRIAPSTVIEVGGGKVGIIGLTPLDTAELSSPGPNVKFLDPLEAVAREAARLEAEGVRNIVVLSHLGLPADERLASLAKGVDLIVGGHSHTLLSNTVEGAAGPYPTWVEGPDHRVAIVHAGAYGKYLGSLKVEFDAEGRLTSAEGEPILLDASVAEDEAIVARVAALAEPIEQLRAQVVAEATAPIDGDRASCRSGECQMGVLVADAMLDRVRDQGVQIALQNGGGLRASIDAGPITMGEVLTVLPFQNALSTFRLSGADVLAALENGLSQVEDGAGRFPQVAGLRFIWDPAAPAGSRVTVADVEGPSGWEPIDPAKMYGVVSNDFMRRGGDGYEVLRDKAEAAYDYGPGLEQVVADYLAAKGPYAPYTDGRIARK